MLKVGSKKLRFHFIGIGGVGMSSLARVLYSLGHDVSGCDLSENKYTRMLKKEGIKVYKGHSVEHLKDVDVVVYSSAIPEDNPELVLAREMGLWVLSRAQLLSEVISLYPKSILIAGSHGKTTTTSMIAEVLLKLGKNPTFLVGGIINSINTHSVLGKGEYLVAEADESDGSFLCYNPFIEVITNIDKEHLDFYADFNAIKKAFINFIKRCSPEGGVIMCGDDPGVREVLKEISGPFLLYGFSEGNELKGVIVKDDARPIVEVYYQGEFLGKLRLKIPGLHNVLNALGVIGVALMLKLPMEEVFKALSEFEGTGRRLEFKGIWKRAIMIDDYAHHPTEIKATLEALKKLYPEKRLVLVFQPHRYTRVKALWNEFLLVLKDVDVLVLTEIYPASEKPIPGVSGEAFYESLKELRGSKPSFFAEDKERVLELLDTLADKDKVIVTMGAGDIYRIHRRIFEEVKDESSCA